MEWYNKEDILALQDNASGMTYNEFIEWVKDNTDWREVDDDLIDFDYNSITATTSKVGNYLGGSFDCWDNDGQWVDTYHCAETPFK